MRYLGVFLVAACGTVPSSVTHCGPENCAGCCWGDTCVSGNDNGTCGRGGLACSSCTASEYCGDGACHGFTRVEFSYMRSLDTGTCDVATERCDFTRDLDAGAVELERTYRDAGCALVSTPLTNNSPNVLHVDCSPRCHPDAGNHAFVGGCCGPGSYVPKADPFACGWMP